MADEEYGDSGDPTQEGANPLAMLATMGSQYTSKEAHDLARRAYNTLQVEREDLGVDEDEISDEQQAAAEEAKTALRGARDKLLQQKSDQSDKWLSLAAALGAPTTSGSFGETLANVAKGQEGVNTRRHAFQETQRTGALEYDTGIQNIDQSIARNRAALATARRNANTRLLQEAMKTLSREVRPGSGSRGMSPEGRRAIDEGFEQGSPEFNARVKELVALDLKNRSATAGTDAPPNSEDAVIQMQDQSHKMGVPISIIDPYRGMSTNQKKTAMSNEQKNTDKLLDDLATVQSDSLKGIQDMNRFLQMNKDVDSGKLTGMFPSISDRAQVMDSITAEASRKMKQPGEGSVSNFDAEQFRLATVSRSKKFQANVNIATAYKVMRKNEIDRVSFLQDYAALNQHLRGANAAWREYLEANPIFDRSQPGKMIINRNRKDYRAFFREQLGDKPAEGEEAPPDEEQAVDPGRYPGDDTPAVPAKPLGFAKGGKVGAAKRMLYQVTCRGKMCGVPLSTRARAMTLRERLADKHPDQAFFIDPVAPKTTDGEFEGYAEGGIVSDDEIYGVPEAGADDEEEDDTGLKALYAALQGASLGLADEVQGTYDEQGAAKKRAEYSDFASAHPGEQVSSFMAGLLPAASLIAPGWASILQLAGLGAGTGALLGATGSTEDRPEGALQGGIEGAVAAPVTALAARYVYNKAGQIVDKLTGRPLSAAEEKLVLAANKDNIDLSQVAAELHRSDRLRVPEGAQDVAGRRTQALIEKAAARGSGPAENFIEGQTAKQGQSYSRVEDQINRGLAPSEYFGEFEKLNTALYNDSKPLYEKAYQKHPGVKSKEFMRLMDTKDGKSAFKEALRLMELDGKPIGKANIAGIVQKPSLEFLDYFKRGLDQVITTEEATKPTTLGHSMRGARNKLRDELDNIAPEYKAARAQYAGDLEVRDALVLGRDEIARLAPEEVRLKVKKMSAAEKDVFRSGVAQHLYDVLGKPSTDFNAAQRLLGSDSMRAKLEATFDDPKKWKVFEAAMDKEAAMYDRTKKMTSRVEGQRLQELKKGDSLLSGVMDSGMANTPGMGGISWVNRVYNWLRFPMPLSGHNANEILKTIDRSDVKAFDATMKRLAEGQKRLKVRGRRGAKVGAIAAILAAGATQPTPPGEAGNTGEEP